MPAERARFAAAHARWLAAALPHHRRLQRALRAPRAAQETALAGILARTAGSAYGVRHGLGRVRTLREYQDRVPVVSFAELSRDVDQMRDGRAGVLTTEPLLAFERTTGSTGGAKLVPYTAGLLAEMSSGLLAWMADTWLRDPSLMFGGAYWSVSPLGRPPETTRSGVPVGFDEDTQYFGSLGSVLQRTLLTPPALGRLPDVDTCRYVTLRHLVQDTALRFASVWHPSFLDLLADALRDHASRLVADVRDGTLSVSVPDGLRRRLRPRPRRAAVLARLLARDGTLRPEAVWPHLRTISCWADAAAAPYASALGRRFPQARLQPKGLLATEGVVSLPWGRGPGTVLAVTSHVLEFVEAGGPTSAPLLADELEPGRTYSVLLTTSGGLHRYALGDHVRVVGFSQRTPRIVFTGRDAAVSDLCGEKLHEPAVREALEVALAESGTVPGFALLAPERGTPPAYALFLESPGLPATSLAGIARRVDDALHANPHYGYCRRLGQLGPVRAFAVRGGGARAYLSRLAEEGQRAGVVKPAALSGLTGWSERLDGAFVEGA